MNENEHDYLHISGYVERLQDDIRRVEGVTNPERLAGLQQDALYIAHRLGEWASRLNSERFYKLMGENEKITKE